MFSIKSVSVRHKLNAVAVSFLIPVLVLLYFLVQEQDIRISFGEKEICGSRYLIPLKDMLFSTVSAMNQVSAGASTDVTLLKSNFDGLSSIHKQFGEILEAEEGFTLIAAALQRVTTEPADFEALNALHDALRNHIAYIGDKSNLILDPDLDSYYVMDVVLLKLPELTSLIGKGVSETIKRTDEASVIRALLTNANNGTKASLEVAFKNNPSNNLMDKLSAPLTSAHKIIGDLQTKFASDYLPAQDTIDIKSSLLQSAVTAMSEAGALWDNSNERLILLLNERIDGLSKSRYLTLFSVFVVLLLAAAFTLRVSRNILQALENLTTATDAYSHGDVSVKARVYGNDEIGKLATSFNNMIELVNLAHDELKEERSATYKKVEEAVRESEENRIYLAKSVSGMLEQMNRFASGDLTAQANEGRASDDIEVLSNGFNEAVSNMRSVLQQVKDTTDITASTALEISTLTGKAASRTAEQSQKTEDVADALSRITLAIRENTALAEDTLTLSLQARTAATHGSKAVQETITGMNAIAAAVGGAVVKVNELGESSNQIGTIISVINDIADQTNLLALNAAIEAARAGDAGRGFAVVADEVRKLAEKTTRATAEIADMIKKIQVETRSTVTAMNQQSESVNEGLALSDRASLHLKEISDFAEKVYSKVEMMSGSAREQLHASASINDNLKAVSHFSNENVMALNEVAGSVNELNQMIESLDRLMGTFIIGSEKRSKRVNLLT